MLNFETLLAPVTPEQPSGSVLEYDPAFTALLERAKGKAEQRMGASVIPAELPDWGKVEEGAVALLARTKDLRVATLLVKARLHNAGPAGFFEGLAFTRALLERHWETIHPQLDVQDSNDPAMRVNALADLADPDTVLASLRNAELANVRGVGRICLRDLERPTGGDRPASVNGEPPAVEKSSASPSVLAACDPAIVADTARTSSAAVADLQAIEAFLSERVGADRVPNFSRLAALLDLVVKVFSDQLARNGPRTGLERKQPVHGGASLGEQAGLPGAAAPFVGAINSRNDVILALENICAYYERFEPSSPIPLLLKRSKRLVAMSFIDIVRDLAPEAIGQVETLRGKQD
ncbi:MAG: hypothetical protein A2V77_20715 [Anaeromyxobacter sp. RBG_16_69_14]|nr:MAG: hypothetical protein A2V77_20715 [Anaeromyxobacter sp. RBG_16_69_14]